MQIVLAETGAEMSRFPPPEHLVSWPELCPLRLLTWAQNPTGREGRAAGEDDGGSDGGNQGYGLARHRNCDQDR